jgi:hypothetical protein
MTITDSEAAVRALLTEAPPSEEVARRGRDRLLALATADPAPARTAGPRPRRRRLTVGLPVTAAAAAVTAIALVAASSGAAGTGAGSAPHGSAPHGSAPHGSGHHGTAAAAGTSVQAKLLAALDAASGQVLHAHTTETVGGQTASSDFWLAPWQAAPGQIQRMRLTTIGEQDVEMIYTAPATRSPGLLTGTGKGRIEGRLIDVEYPSHTWSDQARTPVTAGSPVESPAELRTEIASGQLKVVARTELAGQPVLELQHKFPSPPGSGPWTRDLWVSTSTYLPVRAVSSSTEGTPARGYQSDVTTIAFQFLPATSANLAQLSPVIPAGFTRTAAPPVNLHG